MEIFIILGRILLNGVFAMAELALVSSKRARLQKRAAEGSHGARTALSLAVLKEGTAAGGLEQGEYDIVTRALGLRDQRLSGVMTPGIDLELIDIDDYSKRNLQHIARSPYRRLPIYRGDRSHIIGVVHAGDLLEQAVHRDSIGGIDIWRR
ncbi:CNNM domain-containing protein [Massilia sp. TWR1-2-2]|uniref:CNNM domain-containing protein n=1 Tax=Massilia sp. TWR1-2-2 TaxID=2804584 RepID=UPI003CEC4AE2